MRAFFSTKSKAIILILGLFVLFFVIISYVVFRDMNTAAKLNQQMLEKQINNIYQATIGKISEFYANRAYANLNSQGIIDSVVSKDGKRLFELSAKRWQVLKNENTYLIDMKFYDDELNLLTSLAGKTQRKLNKRLQNLAKPLSNFYLDKQEFTYNILVPITQNERFVGILEFVISANFFVQEMENFADLRGYIFIDNKIYQKDTKIQNGDYVLAFTNREKPHDSICNIGLQSQEEYFLEGKYYTTHVFDLRSYLDTNVGKFVFLQDITKQKEKPLQLFYFSLLVTTILFIAFYIILNYSFNKLLKSSNSQISQEKSKIDEDTQKSQNKKELSIKMLEEKALKQKKSILLEQSKLANMATMVSNVSNQWKEPLLEINQTLVNIGILYKKDKINENEFIKEINKCENIIAFMSRNIDDFSKFFAYDQERKIFNINEICKNILDFLEISFAQNKIKVSFSAEEEFFIDAYPNQFAQAIINILNNAIEITRERQIKNPSISIKITNEKDKAKVQIQDNAGGIKFEPIEQIFEPYTSSKTSQNAVGIGLYMSKMLIEANANGTLSARNEQDGALFEIVL